MDSPCLRYSAHRHYRNVSRETRRPSEVHDACLLGRRCDSLWKRDHSHACVAAFRNRREQASTALAHASVWRSGPRSAAGIYPQRSVTPAQSGFPVHCGVPLPFGKQGPLQRLPCSDLPARPWQPTSIPCLVGRTAPSGGWRFASPPKRATRKEVSLSDPVRSSKICSRHPQRCPRRVLKTVRQPSGQVSNLPPTSRSHGAPKSSCETASLFWWRRSAIRKCLDLNAQDQ